MRLALYQPDIAQNTGTMLRLAACLGIGADVIAPTGFDMTDRALRRAGLDYLAHVEIARHASFGEFEAVRQRSGSRLILLTTRGEIAYTSFAFQAADTLLLGRESAGAYTQQLRVAQGSLKELETHVELAHRVGLIDEPTLANVLKTSEEVGKMLRSLIRAVER